MDLSSKKTILMHSALFKLFLFTACFVFIATWALAFSQSMVLGLALLAGLGYVIAVFYEPLWGTLLFVFTMGFMAFLNLPITGDGLKLSTIFLITAFMIWFARALILKDRDMLQGVLRIEAVLVLAFFLLCITSLINSDNLIVSIKGLKKLTYCILCYFLIIFTVKNKKSVDVVIKYLIGSGIVIGILGIVEAFQGSLYKILHRKSIFGAPIPLSMEKTSKDRINGLIADGDLHGGYMIFIFMLCLYAFFTAKSKKKKMFFAAGMVLSLANIIGAASRGAVIGFVVAVFVWVLVSGLYRKWFKVIVYLAGLGIVGLGLTIFIPDLNIERLYSRPEGVSARTIDLRVNNAMISLAIFADHPLLGAGPDGFVIDYSRYAPRIAPTARKEIEPKSLNLYTQVLAEHGLIGFSIFAAILLLALKRLWCLTRHLKDNYRLLACSMLASYCGYSVFMAGSGHLVDQVYWLMIGIAESMYVIFYAAAKDNDLGKSREFVFHDLTV
jgi:O-antigen ligase